MKHNFVVPLRSILSSISFCCLLLWVGFAEVGARDTADEKELLQPERLGSISGRVLDQQGQPLAGMEVQLTNPNLGPLLQVTTSVTGTYRFATLLTGIYRVQVHDPQAIFATQYYTATERSETATDIIVNGNDVTGIDLRLQPGGRIAGRVTLQGEIPPTRPYAANQAILFTQLANKWQPLLSTPIVTQTGTYSFSVLLPTVYRVCATGYPPGSYASVTSCYGGFDAGSAADITVTSGLTTSKIDIDMAAGQFEGIIRGKVVAGNQPLAGMKVRLLNTFEGSGVNVYTYTNAVGEYEFLGLPADFYFMEYTDPKEIYAAIWHNQQPSRDSTVNIPALSPLQLQTGQVLSNVNVSMVQYGKVQGNLYLGTDATVVSKTIEVQILRLLSDTLTIPATRMITTDHLGNYTLDRLFPGVYTFYFSYCFRIPNGEQCIARPYGLKLDAFSQLVPTEIAVGSGETVTGINVLVGPDPQIFMPLIITQLTGQQ